MLDLLLYLEILQCRSYMMVVYALAASDLALNLDTCLNTGENT